MFSGDLPSHESWYLKSLNLRPRRRAVGSSSSQPIEAVLQMASVSLSHPSGVRNINDTFTLRLCLWNNCSWSPGSLTSEESNESLTCPVVPLPAQGCPQSGRDLGDPSLGSAWLQPLPPLPLLSVSKVHQQQSWYQNPVQEGQVGQEQVGQAVEQGLGEAAQR